MFDINAKQPERATIAVADYSELGRIVLDWIRDPSTRPATADELSSQLREVAVIPRRIRNVVFVQDDDETLHIRLPGKALIAEQERETLEVCSTRQLPIPYFYRDYFEPGFGPVMSAYDMLLARLADAATAQA